MIDLIRELQAFNATVEVWDPWVDLNDALEEFELRVEAGEPARGRFDAVIVAVAHREFANLGVERIRALGRPGAVFFDVKGLFSRDASDGRL